MKEVLMSKRHSGMGALAVVLCAWLALEAELVSGQSDANWSSLGIVPGADTVVESLAVVGTNVYCGGAFTVVGGIPGGNCVARWDGTAWNTLGEGVRFSSGGQAFVLALAGDSSGTVYAGGSFDMAGGVARKNVAKWNETSQAWESLGDGVDKTVIALVCAPNGDLYAGGTFSKAGDVTCNGIAKWSVSEKKWSALGTGLVEVGSAVVALTLSPSGQLYVGGSFTSISGTEANNIAVLDISTGEWSAVGLGTNGGVASMALDAHGGLYVGGTFNSVSDKTGDIEAWKIARWDTSTETWSPLDKGVSDAVFAVIVGEDGGVYAGGYFNYAGPDQRMYIARWDPKAGTWSSLGSGADLGVCSMALAPGGKLFAGGFFETVGGVGASKIGIWDTVTHEWSIVGGASRKFGVSWNCYCLCLNQTSSLYVGGYFYGAGGVARNAVAKLDLKTGAWSSLGTGIDHVAYALAADTSGNIYVGGDFDSAGGIDGCGGIARWNPATESWSALGSGTDGLVKCLALSPSGTLYVGGGFFFAGGVECNYFAQWNTESKEWSSLGGGFDRHVEDIALDSNGDIYACGLFSDAGGVQCGRIARWDENAKTWSPLGNGLNSTDGSPPEAYSVLLDGIGGLYVGGLFGQAGDVPCTNIARWDIGSQTWHALGKGVNWYVRSMAMDSSGCLVVGGWFTDAGDFEDVGGIARWNPKSEAWERMGQGTNSQVDDIIKGTEGRLFVAGNFSVAGGKVSSRIAQYADHAAVQGSGILFGAAEPGGIKPKAWGEYIPFNKEKTAKSALKLIRDTSYIFEWTKKPCLYDKKSFSKAQKDGFDCMGWLGLAQIDPIQVQISISTDESTKWSYLLPPAIAIVSSSESGTVTDFGTEAAPAGPDGGAFYISGGLFGTAAPKVWLEYPDKSGSIKKLQIKLDKKYCRYSKLGTDKKNSCMDPMTGESKMKAYMPKSFKKGWMPGRHNIVVDNGAGLATHSFFTK